MNKKLFIVVILALFIFILFGLFRFHKINLSSNPSPVLSSEGLTLTEMSGQVTKITETSIFIKGSVSEGTKEKEVEFIIAPQTVINKVTVVIRQDQNGQPFKPDTRIEKGSLVDLVSGQSISLIKSQDNLLKVSKTIATEINYVNYEIQKR